MKKIAGFFFACLISWASAQDSSLMAYWSFGEGKGLSTMDSISGKRFLLITNGKATEWESGVVGPAWRMDGYSTWLEGNPDQTFPVDSLTISLWIALAEYPTGIASLYAQRNAELDYTLSIDVDRFGYVYARINEKGVSNYVKSDQPLDLYRWTHLAFTRDTSDTIPGILYVNGEAWTMNAGSINENFGSSSNLIMGRYPLVDRVGLFNKNVLNGLIDEVQVFSHILAEEEIRGLYTQYDLISNPNLFVPESRFDEDKHRPLYHGIPDANWTNEPHGLIYKHGQYNLFYQKNPNGPYWQQLKWGLMVSNDLLTWHDQAPILRPEPGWDQVGIWSGTAFLDDEGEAMIIYTGVDGVKAGMGAAFPDEESNLGSWSKYQGNPIIPRAPSQFATRDFRDPYVWKGDSLWYMIIGSGIASAGSGGAVFLYTSEDLLDWEYKRAMYTGRPDTDDSGIFWEMPLFLNFGEKYVLLVNKVPEPGRRAQALYWVGIFDNNRFIPDDPQPKKLEIVNHLLAPTVLKDTAKQQYVAIGIVPDEVSAEHQFAEGWAHLFSLPRIWELQGDTLLTQRPHPNLSWLRKKHIHKDSVEIRAGEENFLTDIAGKHLEIKTRIDPQGVREFGFYLRRAPDKSEQSQIYYDFNTQRFWVDRTRSSTNPLIPKNISTGSYPLSNSEPFDLHIFLDASIVEVFVNGESAFATRIFPEGEESLGVDAYAKGGTAILESLDVWELNTPAVMTVSNEPNLHAAFQLQAYPHPFSEEVTLNYKLPVRGKVKWEVYNTNGKRIQLRDLGLQNEGKQQFSWKTSDLPAQLYLGVLTVNSTYYATIKMLKE